MTTRRLLGAAAAALMLVALRPDPARGQAGRQLEVTVDSIVVVGNERLTDREVIARSQIRTGSTIQYPDVQAAIHSLFATGDLADVQIRVSRGDPAVFYIEVEERPYVFEYAFEGLEHLSAQAVRDSSGLPAEGPLDPSEVRRAISTIEERLAAKGFPRASVDTSTSPLPAAPGYRLTFRVDEGPRLAIAEIEFTGNEAFTDGQLRSAMSTGEEGFFWWKDGGLRRQRYRQDLTERLPDFYASHGYLDFAVVGDTVIVDPRTGKGRIRVRVREGKQYRLAEFRVEGNRRFPTSQIRSMYDPLAGVTDTSANPPFDAVEFREAASEVEDLYRNSGYLRAAVQGRIQRVRTGEGPPMVEASWSVQEGEPAYIRHVRITGNTKTHDQVIRDRLSIVPGDVYSQQRLISSMRRVQGMGFFESLPPGEALKIQPRDDGDVDITLRVKEKSTGNLNFGMSAAAVTGFAGFIGYQQPNLFGQAKNVNFRWLFGSRTNDVSISYSDPGIFGSNKSVNLTLRRSRDQFRTFSIGTRRQTGGSAEVGVPVLDRWTRVFVGYSLFQDELEDLRLSGPSTRQSFIQEGKRSSASLRLVRDTRNSNRFPTQGSRNQVSSRLTGGVLGGEGEFGKIEFDSEWFTPVAQIGGGMQSRPMTFAAGVSFHGGLIVGENPFFRERFFMGGTQFGEQLRGYEEATVTPSGHVPRNAGFSQLRRAGEAFFTTSAQLGVQLTNQIFLSTFVDGGNIWDEAGDFNPTDLLMGAGVGASVVTPFGPLGIDYAYGFDRRDVFGRANPGWKLHFKFGRIF